MILAVLIRIVAAHPAPSDSFKVAFYNVKSGKGEIALPGAPATFADTSNCADRQLPLNAWGVGAVQRALATVKDDPAVVALGVAEAWICATPVAIRGALGWKASSTERNGVALIARYGFAGPEDWTQLDTSLNTTPNDTMWIVRVPVCLDAACAESILISSAHWYASGLTSGTPPEQTNRSFNRQAQQTVAFLNAEPVVTPQILVGDLNVFAGDQTVCNQNPYNTPLRIMRDAGFVDAWPLLHPGEDGFTGMWNRAGCGSPSGNLWKRIDYSWSRNMNPISMTRFGMVRPGEEAPSDHAGIIVEFAAPSSLFVPIGAPAPGPAFGSFDAPASGSTAAGEVALTGWALDDSGVVGVDIYRSPVSGEPLQWNGLVFLGNATLVAGARPDVVGAYPQYPGVDRAGWGYMLLSNLLPGRGNGTFTLSAYVRTADGSSSLLDSKVLTLMNDGSAAPFGTIDTPAQGASVSGVITNFGWALTPQPRSIASNGSTIDVYVDGILRGHPVYNNYRGDIASIFPGYANSGGGAGYFMLDTRTLANGVHTIAWVVRDSGGTSAGIGSRFFTVANR
jgi:exonuclease III